MKYIITLTLCFGLSCGMEPNGAAVESTPPDKTAVLRPIEAQLHEFANSIVNARETRILSKKDSEVTIRKALFVTAQSGWASSGASLYKTSDGGATWSRLTFTVDEESLISSFIFTDEFRGWLSVTKQRYTERYVLGNSSQIWATNDGGDTWHKQADFPDEVIVRQLSFLNANDGFAIGARVIDRPRDQGPPYDEILILSTSDGGRIWTDNSEGAKEEIRKQSGWAADYGWSIHWRSPTDVFLLTGSARILQTSNRGKTWETIVRFEDERPNLVVSSIGYYKLVFDTAQRVRVIAGAMGDEGFWGDFIVRGEDNSWRSYELMRTPIIDAIFLSQDEIVACGQSIPFQAEKNISGVILHSLDSGKSWQVIYRSRKNETFVSLIRVNGREFYAASDKGTFLKFEVK
jgi:photosystem II stability/assembly factor-like uncharacterized protein